MTTTPAAVRDAMVTEVRALTPTVAADVTFRHFQEDRRVDFRDFCEANPQAAFRLFAIRNLGPQQPPEVTNGDVEWIETMFECVVAYPVSNEYGEQGQLDMDDVIDSDAAQIRAAIGTTGYATLDVTTGGAASVTDNGYEFEDGTACRFLRVELNVSMYRSIP